jgi:5-formyltetrahydrofolate cyclo-ligase
MNLEDRKAAARHTARQRRAGLDPALGAALAANVLRCCPPRPGSVVAGYWPLAGEIDPRPLLHALAAQGFELCLPATPAPGRPLAFHAWRPGDALVTGRYGTRHSTGEELAPNYILVPLLAFDVQGNRLGYGGGYYDRTFLLHPKAFRVGCAFSAQEMADVPTGPGDVRLHAVATELGVRRF